MEKKRKVEILVFKNLAFNMDFIGVQNFVWTFLDNFEWAEGYYPRFGLVYVDFETQRRIIKSSGHWYAKFLKSKVPSMPSNLSKTY